MKDILVNLMDVDEDQTTFMKKWLKLVSVRQPINENRVYMYYQNSPHMLELVGV